MKRKPLPSKKTRRASKIERGGPYQELVAEIIIDRKSRSETRRQTLAQSCSANELSRLESRCSNALGVFFTIHLTA